MPHSRTPFRGMEAATSTTLLYLSKSSAMNKHFGAEKTTGQHLETGRITRETQNCEDAPRSTWAEDSLNSITTKSKSLRTTGRPLQARTATNSPSPRPEAPSVDRLFGEIPLLKPTYILGDAFDGGGVLVFKCSAPYKTHIIQSCMLWAPNPKP